MTTKTSNDSEFLVHLGGKQVDLERAFPFTLGDLKKLKKEGCDLMRLKDNLELEHLIAIARRACHKVDPDLSEEAIEELPLTKLNMLSQAAFGNTGQPPGAVLDRPT